MEESVSSKREQYRSYATAMADGMRDMAGLSGTPRSAIPIMQSSSNDDEDAPRIAFFVFEPSTSSSVPMTARSFSFKNCPISPSNRCVKKLCIFATVEASPAKEDAMVLSSTCFNE